MADYRHPRSVVVPCRDHIDRSICAALAFAFARDAGLNRVACREVAISVAELVSNACRHAGGGVLELRRLEDERSGVEVEVRDSGPGIGNLGRALRDGVSRDREHLPGEPRDGLGAGLGAVKRLMDEMHIDSTAWQGTRVQARKWSTSPNRPPTKSQKGETS